MDFSRLRQGIMHDVETVDYVGTLNEPSLPNCLCVKKSETSSIPLGRLGHSVVKKCNVYKIHTHMALLLLVCVIHHCLLSPLVESVPLYGA